ncbi:cytidine deaminase-like protein [Cladochytrium replicatum]|nr:cytidine deaminase-like protein [Cladochytrium replicatum]
MTMAEKDSDSLWDTECMRAALDQAWKCVPSESAYSVGALLVDPKSNTVLATGFSREIPGNTHAEECALLKLADPSLARGSTCYSTMEPCGERLSGKTPCANLLVAAGVARVVVGIREPPFFVPSCIGTDLLRDSGIVVDYIQGMDDECLAPNKHLLPENKQ